ncbi:MAG: homocysteine S-methyltransferase family protein [Oscillospiraceae bacterium]|jgi:5-methyltetrahydrofolate--homocysteine methyltransferase|nr:homocysteine S-methyltransferase family protein [Oscillospiraceae bacterium]
MDIRELLARQVVFFDGGMGTMLQANGLEQGDLAESMLYEHFDVVVGVHAAYLEAGANIVTTNTFSANPLKLCGRGYSVKETVTLAVRAAREAIAKSGKQAFVAVDIGPTTKLLAPLGELSFDEAYASFCEVAKAGEAAGADLAVIETMTDAYEMKAAVLAVKENTKLPLFATFSFDENARLLTGADVSAAVVLLEGLSVDALGVNCGFGADKMGAVVQELVSYASVPVIVQANAGLPKRVDGNMVYDMPPEHFAEYAERFVKAGARVIGGCCGTTPEHIRASVGHCSALRPAPLPETRRCVISGYGYALRLGDRPLFVAESANPLQNKAWGEALLAGNYDMILDAAFDAQDSGADIFDVNVALPGVGEAAAMREVIGALQPAIQMPLQLSTRNAAALEQALRCYNGKALVNGVTGAWESMHAVFPLIQRYGGVAVVLTMDENGIPETAEGRAAIAKRILDSAAQYGISPCDLAVDTLAEGENDIVAQKAMEVCIREFGLAAAPAMQNRRELFFNGD